MKIAHIIVLVMFFSSSAFTKEKILWVKWQLTPEYIASGPFQDQGYLDNFLAYAMALMPEYEHISEYQTLNRISRSWSNGNVCSLHLWLGYWPDKIVYSEPYGFTPHFGIVTKQNSAIDKELTGKASVSLRYLLSQTDYRMGILPLYYVDSKDSRYPLLAPIIAPYLNTGRVGEFHNSRNEVSVDYLDKHRADYIIRQRITHLSELKINNLENSYNYYYLDEGKNHKLVAAACSNSDFGKSVIKKLNALINEEFYETYIRFRQEWDTDNVAFKTLYDNYFLRNIDSPYITE